MQTHKDTAQSGLFLAIHCFGKSSVSDNEVSLRQIGHSFPPHMFSLHKESLAQYLVWSSPCSQLTEPNESELLLEDQGVLFVMNSCYRTQSSLATKQ